jgi:hypothetical protein
MGEIELDCTIDGGRWDYEEAMRQYDVQQLRACRAEAENVRLRMVLSIALDAMDNANGIIDWETGEGEPQLEEAIALARINLKGADDDA